MIRRLVRELQALAAWRFAAIAIATLGLLRAAWGIAGLRQNNGALDDPLGRWQYDVGLKAAADIHSQAVHGQSGSETDFGGFLGGYIAPMWGWRQFRFGPRLQAGV